MQATHPQAQSRATLARTVRLVAIPVEHGGWGFLLEPVLLGLLVRPSWAGAWLGLSALGLFLTRQPLKLALADRRSGKRYPRTVLAERFALAYLLLAVAALTLAALSASHPFWLPLALAAPLALLQAYFDAQRQSRQLWAESAGALALGAAAPAIALAGGEAIWSALGLWAVMCARSVPSILYVRARLRLERGEAASVNTTPALVVQIAAIAALAPLASLGVAPWLAVAAIGLLALRAAWGLSRYRRSARAAVIGVQEMVAGLLVAILTALGKLL